MIDPSARFDRLYTEDPDPWDFTNSSYEQEKYRATLDALPRPRYCLGIEAGCSIGVLTRMLSCRCDHLIGIDVSEVALAQARWRCADRPNVAFVRANLPADWPAGPVDLVLLSEVLYFLDEERICHLARSIATHWAPGGDCVIVNYLGPTSEALQGAEAANLFVAALRRETQIIKVGSRSTDRYRIDAFSHTTDTCYS